MILEDLLLTTYLQSFNMYSSNGLLVKVIQLFDIILLEPMDPEL